MSINYSIEQNKHYNNLHHLKTNQKKVPLITIKFKVNWLNQKDVFKTKYKLLVSFKWKAKKQKAKLLGKQYKL